MIRARVKEARTGRMVEIRSQSEAENAQAAYLELQRRIEELRDGVEDPQISIPSFGEYAALLLARKVAKGEIKSASSRQKWAETLEHHLLPRFGRIFVDQLRKQDVEDWLADHGRAVRAKTLSPNTVNSWLGVLRVIVNTAVVEYELPRNPIALVKELDTSTWHTYTDEEPNSLTPEEVPRFLAKLRELFPQHFAFVALGFATGLRPSSLRPLRRCGSSSDVLWEQGVLLVRRSQTCSDDPMETTKTGKLQRIWLPEEVIDILRWHVDCLPTAEMRESELLFPNRDGGYRAETHLDRAFRIVAEVAGIKKRITPRGMRRTFQDLARAAEVRDIVTRSVSGHSSEAMQRHYSTVSSSEQKEGLARVVSLAKFRQAARLERAADPSGSAGGSQAADAPSAESP